MSRILVVGGGAAGAALAARISEHPDREVVLLEAGSADGRFDADILDGSSVRAATPGHPANWSYPAHLTPELAYTVARGRILGGSSAINGGYFVRPRPGDVAEWEAAGGPHWAWAAVQPVMAALENDRDFGDRPGHGDAGPVAVVRPPQTNPASQAFLEAADDLGFPAEPDKNAVGPAGAGPVPATVVDGTRVNTALAYLAGVRGRPNLAIRGGVRVLRVRVRGQRAVGVDTDAGRIDADEVVLCAGAVGSAHLLLCSGIGPAAGLRAVGVDPVADLPVGAAFSDHPEISLAWAAREPIEDARERFAFPTALNLDSSGRERRHPDGDLEILLAVKTLGHLLTGGAASWIPHGDEVHLIIGLQSPDGRGTLTLESADPLAPPRIDYRYLEAEADRSRLRTGVRVALAMLGARGFARLGARATALDPATAADDAALDTWVRTHLGTAVHMCGTAPLGSVVDGAGRVHGIDGLRVADTSILPVVPSRGPYASAVLVGELLGRSIRDGG